MATKKQPINKIQLIVNVMTATLDKASKDALALMLKRPNSVRVAKIANFAVSGKRLNQLFSTEELYEITNAVYHYAEELLAPTLNGIQDDELLAQLEA